MSTRHLLWILALAALPLAGCSDDDNGGTVPTMGEIFRIPTEISLEDAVMQAEPGDTLVFLFSPLPLASTVTIQSSQTPLALIGNKNYPTLTAPSGGSALRFLSPKAGTKVEGLAFSGGTFTLRASGSGEVLVSDCRFRDGQVQVYGSGSGLRVRVEDSLFRDSDFFGIEVDSGARLEATRNTVADAGDCAYLIGPGSRGVITSCIAWRAVNYGIACVGGGVYDATSGCNDLFLNGSGPFLDCVEAESDFHVDPLFCDQPNGDYTIQTLSFCAPANSGGCGQVGAFLPACEPPPVVPGAGSPPSP